jgi:hypothetical protein
VSDLIPLFVIGAAAFLLGRTILRWEQALDFHGRDRDDARLFEKQSDDREE